MGKLAVFPKKEQGQHRAYQSPLGPLHSTLEPVVASTRSECSGAPGQKQAALACRRRYCRSIAATARAQPASRWCSSSGRSSAAPDTARIWQRVTDGTLQKLKTPDLTEAIAENYGISPAIASRALKILQRL